MQSLNKLGSSVRECSWLLLQPDERLVLQLVQQLNISHTLATILVNRNISNPEEAHIFLEPKLRDLMPDPYDMKGVKEAVKRIVHAINQGEKVTIFGDYDVDGATSSAIIYKFFKQLGVRSNIYIPNRLSEGYGPNIEAFKKLKAEGTSLILTVDCGTAAMEPLKWAYDNKIDVIVIDHHLPGTELPPATTIVNPNQSGDSFPYKDIAAVGVVFLVLIALRRILREENWFEQNEVTEPDLMEFLDLVAMGTICDVMPLVHINRAFVKHGLNFVTKRNNIGLAALTDMLHIDGQVQCYHLGYVIGPRINAGGRVDESSLGANLLTSTDYSEAMKIAQRLESLNDERKAIESMAMEEAISHIESNNIHTNSIILAIGKNWHIGILGILASRLKERYHKPTIIISHMENGLGKGSGRSIRGLDMGAAISQARSHGLLLEGGGHAMAGGFTIEADNIDKFYHYLLQKFSSINNNSSILAKAKELKIDAQISVSAVSKPLFDSIKKASPFGHGNEQPRFIITDAKVVKARILRNTHVSCLVSDKASKQVLRCVAFRGVESKVGQALLMSIGKRVSLVGTIHHSNIDVNRYEFIIDDVGTYDKKTNIN